MSGISGSTAGPSHARRVDRTSLGSRAADALREEILSGNHPAGGRLVEVELADQLGVSRGTLRGALQQLKSEGLVELVPYTGWRVARMTSRGAWELYTLRARLESLAAGLAAQAITPATSRMLQQAYQRLLDACQRGDYQIVTQADFAVHQTIVKMSGHARLATHYQALENQTKLFLASSNQLFTDIEEIGIEHRALVDAICAGDVAAAEREMAAIIDRDGAALVRHLEKEEQQSSQR